MLREIIKPVNSNYTISIPDEYINTEVEILVLPFSYNNSDTIDNNEDIFQQTAGLLKSHKIDPIKWQNDIRGEYEK